MQRKFWIILALVLVVPGLLTMVSCATQTGGQQTETTTTTPPEAPKAMAPAADTSAAERAKEMARNQFLNENVHFAFDSAALSPRAQDVLTRKAVWLNDNPGVTVVIEGHCDERGTPEYNMALGERRAESARAYLVDTGVSSSRLRTTSYGEEKPLDPRSNEEAWAKNRRGQFRIQ